MQQIVLYPFVEHQLFFSWSSLDSPNFMTQQLMDKRLRKQSSLITERYASTYTNTRPRHDPRPSEDEHMTTETTAVPTTPTRQTRRKRRRRRRTAKKLDTKIEINLSSVQLTQDEVNLLARGLKFCPTPRHINSPEFSADIADFIRRLRLREYFHNDDNNASDNTTNPFRVKSTWTPQPGRDPSLDAFANTIERTLLNSQPTKMRDNLTKRERKAIKRLIKRDDIII